METFFNQLKIGGLGPGALDSDWIPLFLRDCHVGVSLEYHQAPKPPIFQWLNSVPPQKKQQNTWVCPKIGTPKCMGYNGKTY